MTQPTSRKQSSKTTVSETIASAVPDNAPSGFCALCRLVFGSHESRVFVGGNVAHLHCARRLSGPRAAAELGREQISENVRAGIQELVSER